MSALRSALAAAAMETPVAVPPSREAALTQGMRLLSQTPTIVAGWHRVRSGLRPLLPKKSLSYAGNFLAMLLGTEPDAGAARSFDVALILRADNELNPSTFAARVTAATGADVFGCILAALSALAGPRHGWHARRVMAVLEELREPESVEGWVRSRKESGGKIAGFGHQVYRGEDPRTAQLRLLARERCALAGLDALFDTAAALEEAVQRELGQYPIVDFYLAPLYRALGIPTDLFTAVFAVSRMSGWIAHVLEQYGDDKLIRPRAEYVGPLDLSYVPLRRRRA
jgi:citrate synthase